MMMPTCICAIVETLPFVVESLDRPRDTGTLPPMLAAAQAADVSLLWSIPFITLLLATALTPAINIKFWHHHYAKIALGLGAITAVYYFFIRREPGPWFYEMQEYVSFIVLLASLYVVSGGIFVGITKLATPKVNCVLLLIGAILANVIGTTGASMLLIRPFMRINRDHIRSYHIVFFIFIVSNCGGLLTPIGDPPLFLGFLQGIPFWWTFDNLLPMWLFVISFLLAIFYIIDKLDSRSLKRESKGEGGPVVHMAGLQNIIWVSLILYGAFRPAVFDMVAAVRSEGVSFQSLLQVLFSREVLMTIAAVCSRLLTARTIYEHNHFNYDAIREVAILFVGIFSTMTPALEWLRYNADKMPLDTPGQYYFACGGLSGALDNAPTYLTFLHLKLARQDSEDVARLMAEKGYDEHNARMSLLLSTESSSATLVAISLGAVLFGAMTYIGNGPNLMVKSIAENAGVGAPSFIRYVVVYAIPMLLPVLFAVWWIFLR
jgi:Na+/H+ antiporter NhaD/arsenite permease-like protein